MSLVRKAALFCDGCSIRVDLDPDRAAHLKFGTMALRGTDLEGWREAKPGKHLCPSCAEEYAEVEREFQQRLDRMLGSEPVRFDL